MEDRCYLCAVNIISKMKKKKISILGGGEQRAGARADIHTVNVSSHMLRLKDFYRFHFPGIHLKYNEALRNTLPTRRINDA